MFTICFKIHSKVKEIASVEGAKKDSKAAQGGDAAPAPAPKPATAPDAQRDDSSVTASAQDFVRYSIVNSMLVKFVLMHSWGLPSYTAKSKRLHR